MSTSTQKTASTLIGERIRKLRQERKLTQEALAGEDFTKGYVSALERGAVRPSLKALEVFARRLGVPIAEFVSTSSPLTGGPSSEALHYELVSKANYAKMLLRTGHVAEALQLIDDMEGSVQPYRAKLVVSAVYLIPFLRGRAHLQTKAYDLARTELEAALAIAAADPEARAHVRNLLGVVLFELSQPHLALEQHLLCLKSIENQEIDDPTFRVSVYRNIVNDYLALNQRSQALDAYKEVMPALGDLSSMQQQATAFWRRAVAWETSEDWWHARLYAERALYICEASDSRAEAALICLNLAETRIGDGQLQEAGELIERADTLLSGTGNEAVLSYLCRERADLARREGQHEKATEYASRSVSLAETYYNASQSTENRVSDLLSQDPIRIYAKALQMEALSNEDQGGRDSADRLFEQALELVSPMGFEEIKHAINLSYAKVLEARGEFEKAMGFYRIAAELQPHVIRKVN